MKTTELEPLIIDWARAKGLIQHTKAQAIAQHTKTVEEVGELMEAIEVYNGVVDCLERLDPGYGQSDVDYAIDEIRLEAGDVLVTLVIQAAIHQAKFSDCVEIASREEISGECQGLVHHLKILKSWLWVKDGGYIGNPPRAIGYMAKEVMHAIAPYNLTLDECLEAAWLKIRDRTGQTVDGVFVKDD